MGPPHHVPIGSAVGLQLQLTSQFITIRSLVEREKDHGQETIFAPSSR
jgi:hypothetical protein